VNRNYLDPRLRGAAEMACAGIFLMLSKRTVRGLDWRLLCVIALALLYWFFSAPELRFGVGFLFAGGFLLLAYGIECAELLRLEDTNTWALIAMLAIGFARIASVQQVGEWPKTEIPQLRLATTPTGHRIWAPPLKD